jgi:hypothetical protein
MDATGIAVAVIIALAVIVGVGWFEYRRREFGKLDVEVQHAVTAARSARKQFRAASRLMTTEVASIERTISELSSVKGQRVAAGGGVTVYQRWIDTRQGSGSIIGVTASAADESTNGAGNAYVVVDGPAVNGVATLDASKDPKAGLNAYALAAAINKQARLAADEKKTLPEKIERAKSQLTTATRSHEQKVEAARSHFRGRLEVLPTETRAKYFRNDHA